MPHMGASVRAHPVSNGRAVGPSRQNRPMLSLRVFCPADLAAEAEQLLAREPSLVSLAVVAGGSREPAGDLLVATIPRTTTDAVIGRLQRLGVTERGTIEITTLSGWTSQRALAVQQSEAPDDQDAVVWTDVVQEAYDASGLTWGFLAFMTMATVIASIAIVLDSQVLIIGAMVLGPEFGAIAALGVALVTGRPHLLWSALRTLLLGFVIAISITTALFLVLAQLGWVTSSAVSGPRPFTEFIYRPDNWSIVIAIIAGIAGVIALVTGRSATLTGVFISVTTIPAAGNIALALPFGDWDEVTGSALQLGINITGMAVAGSLTLLVLRRLRIRAHRKPG